MSANKPAAATAPKNATNTALKTAPAVAAADEGWDDCGTPDIDAWFKGDAGASIEGKLVGMINIQGDDGKRRDIVLVRLTKDCTSTVESGSQTVVTTPAGKVVGLGINFALRAVPSYVTNQGMVRVTFLEKKALKGGRSVWKTDCKCKGIKAVPPVITLGGNSYGEDAPDLGDTDDLNF